MSHSYPIVALVAAGLLLSAVHQGSLAQDPPADDSLEALWRETLRRDAEPGPRDAAGEASLALAKLHLERAARIRGGETHDYEITLEGEIEGAREALRWLDEGRPPHEGVTGENLIFAYETANDHSVQPFFLYVPEGHQSDAPTPLVVYLHGWLPETSKLCPWLMLPEMTPALQERGWLFLQPHGRRNMDFQGVGEVDVLQAIEEVSKLYSVDPERIYLAGNSMGGYGAYCIAAHHPDRFAALSVASAQSDYYTWYGIERDAQPVFKQAMYGMSNPVDLMGNLTRMPVHIEHGEWDYIVPTEHAHIAAERLTELGAPPSLHIEPEGPHEIYLEPEYFERVLAFLADHTRADAPAEISYTTYTLDSPGAYWARVGQIADWGLPASFRAKASAGRIEATCTNVAAMEFDMAPQLGEGDAVTVVVNGQTVYEGERPATGPLRAPLDGYAPGVLEKRPGLCGPIRAVFDEPFLVVHPDGPGGARHPLVTAFAAEWWTMTEGLPFVAEQSAEAWPTEWALPAGAVTPEIAAERNLVLFGRPEENAYLASIADRLPVEFIDGGCRLNGVDYTGGDAGLWFCHPNPAAPDRLILSVSGAQWGGGYSLITRYAHRYDLLPDFIVFDAAKDAAGYGEDDMNPYRAAGFFDASWRFGRIEHGEAG